MNKLYIFSTSFNPDVYINTIVHFLNSDNTKKVAIEVITVFENTTEKNKLEDKYKNTVKNIDSVLEELGKGVYKITDKEKKERIVELDRDEKKFYERSKTNIDGEILSKSILYEDLENEILSLISASHNKFIFDLSGERKYLLVDILFISLANNCENLFVFDILREQDFIFKEKNLIHSLKGNEYKYRNLIETKYVQNSIQKLSKNKDLKLLEAKDKIADIIDLSARNFVRGIVIIVIVIIVMILAWFLKSIDVIKSQWNEIEPKTFIWGSVITILLYLAQAIILLLFTKEFALTPRDMYNSAIRYKKRQLTKKFNP